jgi:small-conductance mechanosensitive channel
MNAINRVFEKKDAYLPQLKENVRKVISDNGAVTEIDRQLTELEQQIRDSEQVMRNAQAEYQNARQFVDTIRPYAEIR